MNSFDTLNLEALTNQPGLLNPENFYLKGEKQNQGIRWRVHQTNYPIRIAIARKFNPLIVQGASFIKLAKAAANEHADFSFHGLEHNHEFVRFCRRLEGIETAEHQHLRNSRTKEKFFRAVEKAKQIGKGLAKYPQAKILEEHAWLEKLHPDHPYAFDLHKEWLRWQSEEMTTLSFEEWRHEKGLVGTSFNQVKYLNEQERQQYEVTIEEGKLMRHGEFLNTASERSIFSGQGIAIYVISPEGKLYVGSHDKGKFHHSSFLSGAVIKGGGEIQTDCHGQVKYLSPKSGHYNPKKEFLNVLEWLQAKGVPLDNVELSIPHQGKNLYYRQAKQFLLAEGALLPDGIDQATFERDQEGKIAIIHQHALHASVFDNRHLLQSLQVEGVDLSQVLFREDTAWGDIFSYSAQDYLEKKQLFPAEWEGGTYIKNEKGEVSEIYVHRPKSADEKQAVEKNFLLLRAFAAKGANLCSISFSDAPSASMINAQTYMDLYQPQYLEWYEKKLQDQLSI